MDAEKTIKTAVLTGSTGGIGSEIAKLLAQRGWDLVLVNRSADKSQKQADGLRRGYSNVSVSIYTADLLDQTDIITVCKAILKAHPKLDALYNLAGFLSDNRVESVQGIEAHFAINTVAPYLFANQLSASLSAGKGGEKSAVVVNFGSSAVNSVKKLEVQSLANPAKIGGLMGAYANSKLALMAMTLAMDAEAMKSNVLFQVADPGPTKTSMTHTGDGMPWFLKLLVPLIFKTADVQAKRLVDGVQKAVAEGESGLYISEGRRKRFPKLATDKTLQSDLMQLLTVSTGLTHE
ncbi:MAG: SDR family NAD(P)-dependent oxidoreductase [Planctomycetota bacterium]